MAECEICGATIVGKAQYITIGSSQLRVCRACARYGTSAGENQPAKARTSFTSEQEQLVRAKQRLYEQMDHELEEELGIPEDFGRRIKEARERVGLKQAELAQRINEKQSLLRKIEHEEIMPTDEVRAKLERVLKISL
ncbi:MAG TPA: TIGR00270 family protein [Methanomicrobia archaeon]|nr:TIGR00270 family protein [Methanomicrobia archaeon]